MVGAGRYCGLRHALQMEHMQVPKGIPSAPVFPLGPWALESDVLIAHSSSGKLTQCLGHIQAEAKYFSV